MNCKWFCCTLYLIIFFTWIWYCSHNGFFSMCVYLFLFENYLHNLYYYFVFIAFLMCDCSKKITCVLTSKWPSQLCSVFLSCLPSDEKLRIYRVYKYTWQQFHYECIKQVQKGTKNFCFDDVIITCILILMQRNWVLNKSRFISK